MIHDAAGPELLASCRRLGGCEVGDAKVTPGFRLPARWVIHTVGPIWRGGGQNEEDLLASCYRRCMEEATRIAASTVAFPGISTRLHRFPVERAARTAVQTVSEYLARQAQEHKVTFVCFDQASLRSYERLLSARTALLR